MNDLFRPEARAHKTQRFHGAILLTRTWSYPAFTAFFCCMVLGVIVFACLAGFTRKETVHGMLVPDAGIAALATPQAGSISAILAAEGQDVRSGDPLFVLSGEHSTARGPAQASINDSLENRIAALQGELGQQGRLSGNRARELQQQASNLQASQAQLDAELGLQEQKLLILQGVAAQIAELAKDGAVTRHAADDKAAQLLAEQARRASLLQQRLGLQRDIAALKAARADLPLQAGREQSQLQRTVQELNAQLTEGELRREWLVRATQTGRVTGIVVHRGQTVTADQRLASLVPAASRLEAELYVPTRAIGFVRPGTEVLLRYDAFPYQKFGQFHGRVREISLSAIAAADLQRAGATLAEVGAAEPLYRLRVQLDAQQVQWAGQAHALKPGMQVGATLVLEQRTLAEWALEPLLASAKR